MKLIIHLLHVSMKKMNLPKTIAEDLPKEVEGFDEVEIFAIDDGSTDKTFEVAKKIGVHHIIQPGSNRGLATAFKLGDRNIPLDLGADAVVNTDGDESILR